jgi:signal transduction histidine kinase
MRKLIDSTLQTVKRISTDLRPELLDDLGLSAAIEWQGGEFQNRTGIKSEVTMDPEEIILDQDCSIAIFRIFQETLTNVARHSHATRVTVKLKMKTGKIELKVKDNGKGITEKQISGPKSFGLIGIRERVHFLDGNVEIKGVQGKGTTVTVRIPIHKEGKTG